VEDRYAAPRQVTPFRISAEIAWLMRNCLVYTTSDLAGHPTVPANELVSFEGSSPAAWSSNTGMMVNQNQHPQQSHYAASSSNLFAKSDAFGW